MISAQAERERLGAAVFKESQKMKRWENTELRRLDKLKKLFKVATVFVDANRGSDVTVPVPKSYFASLCKHTQALYIICVTA